MTIHELDEETWRRMIDDEVAELLSRIDKTELVQVASALNGGKQCTFRPGKHLGIGATMGCANYHAWLDFDDDEKWLVRVPRTTFSSEPAALTEYLVASEYATLKFLETTKVPAPKAFGLGLLSDPANHVGINYLFIQALPGEPYYASSANTDQKNHVVGQVADILAEISNHPFEQAGSLLFRNGNMGIAEIASDRFVNLCRHGPFSTDVEYFLSFVDQHLDLIADGQLYHAYPKEAFLFYRLLRQHILKLCADEAPSAFFLKHVDDKGDHLLVDENYNIVGIIDWQFTRTVPICEAFGPSLLTADLRNLYSRHASITNDDRELSKALRDRGRHDLAQYTSGTELIRRFHFGLASGLSRDEACEMIAGVLVTLGSNAPEVDVERWIDQEWAECRDDPRFAQIEALILQ